MQFITLLALAATGALAAPLDSHSNGSKSSGKVHHGSHHFKVNAPGRSLQRTPQQEISRVIAKYNWNIAVIPDSVQSSLDDILSSVGDELSLVSATTVSSHSTSVYSVVASQTAVPASAQPSATFDVDHSSTKTKGSSSPVTTKSPASLTTEGDGDGEVTATPEDNNAEYLSPVTIGGQKVNLDFDTGSADLWVFSTLQPKTEIGGHAAFNSNKSSTFELIEGATWKISYGDNSGASGVVGTDHVQVGDLTVEKQAVELATEVSQQFETDTASDGLLGLGFSRQLNTVRPNKQKTWFENIASTLDAPLFTADLDDKSSTYEFGAIDNSKHAGGEIHYTAVDSSRGWWEFTSSSYSINGQTSPCSTCSPVIADTGTSLMMVDDDIVTAYYAQVQGAKNDEFQGGWTYPCDAELPDFGVAITDSYTAVLKGSGLTYFNPQDGQNCFGGLQSNQGQGLQIYGDVFFKQFFVVFDAGNDVRLGVAAKK